MRSHKSTHLEEQLTNEQKGNREGGHDFTRLIVILEEKADQTGENALDTVKAVMLKTAQFQCFSVLSNPLRAAASHVSRSSVWEIKVFLIIAECFRVCRKQKNILDHMLPMWLIVIVYSV